MSEKSDRSRLFFLTAHKNAPCFEHMEEILKDGKFELYALILHDKDIEEDGTITPPHWHAVLECPNARTFNAIRKQFEGAHIVIPDYKKSTYQYLLHNSPNSKEKYQYDFEKIISNSPESVKAIIESEEYEPFQVNRVNEYIVEGTTTAFRFNNRFGFDQYCKYWKNFYLYYKEVINDTEAQSALDEIERNKSFQNDF